MDFKGIIFACLFIACFAGYTEGRKCYSCDRIRITNYNGADEDGVDAALTSVLDAADITNENDCTSGSLTSDQEKTCDDDEACYVMVATFEMDFNSDSVTTVSAEGEIRYCLTDTERLPDIEFGCEDESHAEFDAAADNSIGLLSSEGSPFSNTASYNGELCKCTADLCNGDAADAADNLEGESSGVNVKQIYLAYILAMSAVALKVVF